MIRRRGFLSSKTWVTGWPAKRVLTLILTLALAGLGLYMWRVGVGDWRVWEMTGVGIVLGALYTVRGGSLPSFVYRLKGETITADDDERNLSPRIYLPILLGAIIVAVVVFYFCAPHR